MRGWRQGQRNRRHRGVCRYGSGQGCGPRRRHACAGACNRWRRGDLQAAARGNVAASSAGQVARAGGALVAAVSARSGLTRHGAGSDAQAGREHRSVNPGEQSRGCHSSAQALRCRSRVHGSFHSSWARSTRATTTSAPPLVTQATAACKPSRVCWAAGPRMATHKASAGYTATRKLLLLRIPLPRSE